MVHAPLMMSFGIPSSLAIFVGCNNQGRSHIDVLHSQTLACETTKEDTMRLGWKPRPITIKNFYNILVLARANGIDTNSTYEQNNNILIKLTITINFFQV